MFFCHKWDILFHFAHSAPKKRNISLINAKKCIFWRVATRKSEHFISLLCLYLKVCRSWPNIFFFSLSHVTWNVFCYFSKSLQKLTIYWFSCLLSKISLGCEHKKWHWKKKLFMTYCTEKVSIPKIQCEWPMQLFHAIDYAFHIWVGVTFYTK